MNEELELLDKDFFITTVDNPYNYFTQFDDWLAYDRNKGYYTLEYIARLYKSSNDLGEKEQKKDLLNAILSIIEWNGDMYKIVVKD